MGARAALFLFLSVFSAAQVRRPDSQIKYVVIIFQENRSPDNLFHGLPKADIANVGLDSHGKQVTLTPIPLVNNYDLNHINSAFTIMYDDGRMDGANKNPITCAKGARKCPPLHPQYKYVRHSDVKPYFTLAKQYTFGDRMFQTNEGSSFPAHQFIIWDSTAIFITWDDWGGWYDHVPPPAVIRDGLSWGSGYVYGFRVPLIVVSPYAKQHYVSKVNHDFGSILRFVEETYGLPSLGYADAHADDLSDCFDFQHNGHTFRKILAPYDAKYFLSDTEPATDPDDE